MIVAVLAFFVGCCLSAFFSGSETGFYRASRVRLVLQGLAGDWPARGLLWLTNNPGLFVGTTLIGNNIANYIVSLAVVLAAQRLFSDDAVLAELLGPVVFAPVVFVYGESLPKSMFFQAPNRLLRLAAVPFMAFGVLAAPLVALLWAGNRLLQWLLGAPPETVRLALARKELERVFQEGHEVGILQPAQKSTAQNLFAVAARTVGSVCVPEGRVARVRVGDARGAVLRLAKRHGMPHVPVSEPGSSALIGFVRVVDLHLRATDVIEPSLVRPLPEVHERDSLISALLMMRSRQSPLARVLDARGATVGLLRSQDLTEVLLQGA